MGKRGPAPTPTTLRLLKGDRKDRVNTREPKPAVAPIAAPDYLDDDARKVWDRLAADHFDKAGVSHWDVDNLAAYCTAVAFNRRAAQVINDTGVLLKAGGGHAGVVKHPALQIWRDTAHVMHAIGARFGLTPSDRAGLVRPGDPEGSTADRLLS